LILIAAVGIFAGFINVLAASGSMLVLPLLIFMGVDPNVANGTNRIAILTQNIIAVWRFRKQNLLSYRVNTPIMIAAVIGALFGTLTVVSIDKEVMNFVIGSLLIIMFFIMLYNPNLWIKSHQHTNLDNIKSKTQYLVFFLIGFYGGFIQAGVGVFLLAGLVVGIGYDLLRANAVKTFIMLAYTPISLIIFIYYGLIDWQIGISLAIGQSIGAFVASEYATKIKTKFLGYFLLVIILLSGLKLVGFFDLFF
jgi:hypothetical protein